MSTGSLPGRDRPDPSLSAITSERPALINLAYRMLGSLAEAEAMPCRRPTHAGTP